MPCRPSCAPRPTPAGRPPGSPNQGPVPPLTFGLTLPPDLPPALLFRLAGLAEALGFERLWFPDHLLNVGGEPAADAWSVLDAVAARTRRLQLGTAVSDPHRTHPAVLAQRIATVDRLSQGRLLVGLGSGEAMNLDPFGIPWDRAFSRLKESVAILRHLLDSPEPLDLEGQFYRLRQARIGVRPHRDRHVPLYLAALGPKTLAWAGQVADGWFPVVIPPEQYGRYCAPMVEAARTAGRDPEALDRVVMLPFALGAQGTEVERRARKFALSLVWPDAVRNMGLGHLLPQGLETDYIRVNPCDPRSVLAYQEGQQKIPDELLRRFMTWGDLEALSARIHAYVEAGATHFDLLNASADPLSSTVAVAAVVMPRFTGRPPTLAARAMHAVLGGLAGLGLEGWVRRLLGQIPEVEQWLD